jgi:hypothetical protein
MCTPVVGYTISWTLNRATGTDWVATTIPLSHALGLFPLRSSEGPGVSRTYPWFSPSAAANSAMLWWHPAGRVVACPCGLAEAPCSVSWSGRTAHTARVVRPNFPIFGHNDFSTRQRRWEWTSPLFFWDQARVKWYTICPPSHLKFRSWIQDGGLQNGSRGTHVTHFVQLYPQPLYNASQVRTTSRSWDKGVLTDLCLIL